LAEDVALLKTAHEQLAETIAGIPASRYRALPTGGKKWTIGELIVGIAQHDAYCRDCHLCCQQLPTTTVLIAGGTIPAGFAR